MAAAPRVYAAEPAGDPVTVLALGDSLFAGFGLDAPEDAFPAQLEASLRAEGYNVRILNAGVSGDTTRGGLARLDWSLADDPDAAIVALGANDMLRGLPADAMAANLTGIVETLQAEQVAVLLVGVPALGNWGATQKAAYAAAFPAVAEATGVPLHPDLLLGVAGEPALNQNDGIHPNRAGVSRMVEAMLPAVRSLIAPLTSPAADAP